MIIAFLLKMLCDISFYMCFAGAIGSTFKASSTLFPYVFLLSLSAALSMFIDSKASKPFMKYIPLVVASCIIGFAAGFPTALLFIPAALYVLYICKNRFFHPEYSHTAATFQPLLIALALLAFIMLSFGGRTAFEVYVGPFIVIYLLGMILLMRILRHSESAMNQPSFIMMNGVSVGIVSIISLALFNKTVLHAILTFLFTVYQIIATPIVYIVGAITGTLAWIVTRLILLLPRRGNTFQGYDNQGDDAIRDEAEKRLTSGEFPKILTYIICAVLIAALLYFIYKKLIDKNEKSELGDGGGSYEYAAPDKKTLSFSSVFPTSPVDQVRFYYRKLLNYFKKQDADLTGYMDTSQIEELCSFIKPDKKEPLRKMRLKYQSARYGNTADKKDAEDAKNLYHEIKKASK